MKERLLLIDSKTENSQVTCYKGHSFDRRKNGWNRLFFIHVFKWLASAVVEKIEDDLVENLNDSIHDKKEKAQIEQKLNETFERLFKEQYEYLPPLSKESDINTLNEWLLENLYTTVLSCFIADSLAKRSYNKNSLMKSSYARARADTKEKKAGGFCLRWFFSESIWTVLFRFKRQSQRTISALSVKQTRVRCSSENHWRAKRAQLPMVWRHWDRLEVCKGGSG